MIRDRTVVGIRDDSTRHKLLQIRDLSLQKTIDICKASEAVGRQLKAMTSPDDVHTLQLHTKRSASRGRYRDKSRSRGVADRDKSAIKERKCKYCDRQHEPRKEACPAYRQVCRRCSKRNHFESVCRSSASTATARKSDVCELSDVEQLLTLTDSDTERWYTRMDVCGKTVRFFA
jgi:hypothetical protein